MLSITSYLLFLPFFLFSLFLFLFFFVSVLDSAWDNWASLPERCLHFVGAKASGSDIPSLILGNGANRDVCQQPGRSVYSQACFYMVDNEAPIFEALRSALVADMTVVKKAIENFNTTDAESSSTPPSFSPSLSSSSPSLLYASYALITHPGHHASHANCSGYCYINSAAIIARELVQNRADIAKIAVVDIDYHAGSNNGSIALINHK